MSITYNERFFLLFEALKKKGELKTYVELGKLINESKVGINDLKTERKKVSIQHIHDMKISYNYINADYLIGASNQLYLSANETSQLTSATTPDNSGQQETILALKETIEAKNETIAVLKALLAQKK
ncbi:MULTISPECIES: hypothetical protein [unclassified Sphingobacterium]|uniref:hypothetical protein n=1 Tax=unclassified Sphingobacterium TaxID=2609468 RepID=UPI0010509A68|nr:MULTISPECIES: hypothetical protein [unclassified Sphingobacterium]MCS3556754.1 hypothetical protein [Sphingobacterium sp. JUb21]TCQ99576.1 hypothetical protein EDF66_114133 [Sphingobacterium sp. JUb20]